jgi:integrase/recombinase XerD
MYDITIFPRGQKMKIRQKKAPGKTIKRPRFLYSPQYNPAGIDGYARAFIEHLQQKNYSPATIRTSALNLGFFIDWCFERSLMYPEDITRHVVDRYRKYLFRYRKPDGEPLAFRTQTQKLVQLRNLFSYLCKKHVLLYNPTFDLELPKTPRTLPRNVMTEQEVERVLALPDTETILGIRDRTIMEVLYSTGIRRGELVNLRIFDVSRDLGYLTIREGKGRKDRVIPIGERALLWLDKYLNESRPSLMIADDENALFLTNTGWSFSLDVMSNLIRNYIKASGIPKQGSCHMFRHTFATVMLEHGADIRHIQKMLGHTNLEATEIYTHVAIKALKDIHTACHPAKNERTPREELSWD